MSDMDISLRARFERFPATVKGAFVVRGEDINPHQIAFLEARVVRIPGATAKSVPLSTVTLDVPPHKDVFVPFEFPITDLEPGWYGLEADVDVDGGHRTMPGGKNFCIPWPRSVIRAANVRVDHTLKLGNDATVVIERCQSGTEGLALRFAVDPPQEVTLRLFGDEARLDVVEQEVEPSSGKGTVRAYPLLRPHRTLRIEVGPKGAKGLQSVSVDLS